MLSSYKTLLCATVVSLSVLSLSIGAFPQTGSSTSVTGTVVDPSGAVIPNATVEIQNPVSGLHRTITTDGTGKFSFPNLSFNPYHLTVTQPGFEPYAQDIDVRSSVPLSVTIALAVTSSSEAVTVEGEAEDLLEKTSTFHTDVDRAIIERLPIESASSALSSAITLASPGVAADSNGSFHALGDHAETSFSVDEQPITDQQSKVFSNQIPLDAVDSLEVISGAPAAEYGEKTSAVINVTTRSGQGLTRPKGAVTASYGSFGTADVGFNLGYGGEKWGNFISVSGLNGGRFLDPPEFAVTHDKGNEENLFDRVDAQLSKADSVHINLGYTRSWFQTPNSFDAQNATAWSGLVVDNGGLGPNGLVVGPADQRSQIKTFNIAPSWTRILSTNAVFTLGAFVRHDQYNYYPSANPFADLTPNLQAQSVGQDRTLTNAGLRSSVSYAKGIHNVKAGITWQHTFLNENDRLTIVDPTFNPICLNADGSPNTNPAVTNPTQCGGPQDPGGATNPNFNDALLPYDLTRGGGLFPFKGHTDVKQLGIYLQDSITKGSWSFNVGVRGDFYNGLTTHREAEPRVGIAYNIKPSNTVIRISYARTLETPFNENLVLSSIGCGSTVLNPLLGCTSQGATPFSPGWRNEFHAGIQQAVGRYVVFSGEYIWKYTHNAYDFSILGATPITFPIAWQRSKIPGFAGRLSVPNFHGFSALTVFSSVAARFFTPQVGGAGAAPAAAGGVFRIDHDEKFNQTTHLQYQPWKLGPWVGFNWRYDSGLVAGAVPVADASGFVDLTRLTADQQLQAGLFCGSQHPSIATPLTTCSAGYGSTLITLPAPGRENDDHNPPRITKRNLFDVSMGHDNLFHNDKYKWSLQLTAINVTNKKALYNFLSTFSGTHYVTPRALTAELGFHF